MYPNSIFAILTAFIILVALFITVSDITFALPIGHKPEILNNDSLTIRKIADKLDRPSSLAVLDNDIFIAEVEAKVKLLRVFKDNYTLFDLEIQNHGIDNALIGMAAMQQKNDKYLFLLYAETGSGTDGHDDNVSSMKYKLYRYTWDPSETKLTNETLIYVIPLKNPVNLGGKMAVGPDDQLYVTIGDQNILGKEQNIPGDDNPPNIFYDDKTMSGAILRLNINGSASQGNPFVERGFESYYAFGIRNSFGLAFDPISKYLWDTEIGPGSNDEINLVKPGFNSGWRSIQGNSHDQCCATAGFNTSQSIYKLLNIKGSHYDEPKAVTRHSPGLTGITFINSDKVGVDYNNSLFVGDSQGNVYNFTLDDTRQDIENWNHTSYVIFPGGFDPISDLTTLHDWCPPYDSIFARGFGPISDLAVGPNGSLLVLTYSDYNSLPTARNSGSLYSISKSNENTSEPDRMSFDLTSLLLPLIIVFAILLLVGILFIKKH